MRLQKPHLLAPDDQIRKKFRYEFDGEHDFALADMDCPECTAWGTMGSRR